MIDTQNLDPGNYQLLISQGDNKPYRIDFRVLSNPPKITNLPIIANEGVTTQHYVLKGASPRTATLLARRSFRNWFRPEYPHMYAGFRLVKN